MKTQEAGAQRVAVGMLGLGIMGSAMTANLVKAGFDVTGYDPVAAARGRLLTDGGHPVADALDAIRPARFLLLSLPSEAALESVTAQIAEAGQPGLIVAETSTLPVEAKQRAHDALQARGITLLDCPLSGTGAQAITRDLAVYASGDAAAIADMQPVFDGFARVTYVIGAFGQGMQMKLMANLLVSIHNVSTAEALLMGSRMGIDMDIAVKVLADGAGGSRMLEVRGPLMSARSWDQATMKVSTWQKDIKLIAAALESANVPAPLFNAAIPIYNAAMGMGHGDADTASVYDVLERMSSLRR
ncbi:MAG TPA: NAD(P)-dependent oxidoreductase [Ideonella sp.]|nr:NAD(P)-dependent oxidoreductase [Ideonella sp.]